jgi:hypothetical protein
MIIEDVNELPDDIRLAADKLTKLSGGFILSFKTQYKPNATTPVLWFTLFEDGVAFLTPHIKRSVYLEIPYCDINSIRIRPYEARRCIKWVAQNRAYQQ